MCVQQPVTSLARSTDASVRALRREVALWKGLLHGGGKDFSARSPAAGGMNITEYVPVHCGAGVKTEFAAWLGFGWVCGGPLAGRRRCDTMALVLVVGSHGAVTLADCDGNTNLYDAACIDMTLTDLSFCRCQLCQVYQQRTVIGVSPDNVNSVTMTHLPAGNETEHELCLNHWTFFRMETTPPSVQQWLERDVGKASTIATARGLEASTPHALTITLDTQYNADAQRFTTVDAFLHLSPTLPARWGEVHYAANAQEYPRSVFTDASTYVELFQRDSFTYTLGLDDTSTTCAAPLPDGALYLAVRCGAPNGRQNGGQHYGNQDEPCRFRVRYMLVPQHLSDGDALGPLPLAPGDAHTYSVPVGGYDVLQYTL